MNESVAADYLRDAVSSFRAYKKLADKAIEQLNDEEFFVTLDSEANSVAVVMKHLAGNMLSRWTDFLTSDGEKPDRNRDMEFVIEDDASKESVLAYWERGWQAVFNAVEPLQPAHLDRTVAIRGETHTIVQAINRQMTHYAYHIGQIVFLAKHFRSSDWKSLSIPRKRSTEFNSKMSQQEGGAADTAKRFDVQKM